MCRSSRVLAVLLLVVSLWSVACGGRQQRIEGGESLLTGEDATSMMGDSEALALGLLEDMTLVLAANASDPTTALERMQVFVRVNRDDMRSSAEAIEARRAGMSVAEARRYEAQLSAYLAEAHRAWRAAMMALQATNGDIARQVQQLVARVDD